MNNIGKVETVYIGNDGVLRTAEQQRIRDLEAQVESLQNKWASRPLSSEDQAAYIAKLEAALKDIAVWQSDLADAKKVAAWALGLTAETKGEQT